jgi:CubicO group peptidase (beta-lactamase class C family)
VGVPPTLYQHPEEGAPLSPKEGFDNPLLLAPAGGVYLSLSDWARFAAARLKQKHTPEFEGSYAGGWIVVKGQPWAGGIALTHAGSNTMNFALAWLAPERRFAALIATNAYKKGIEKAANDAVLALIASAKL